ncbi:MAG: hypothetical protein AAGD22_17010 [Verrucomicrobiota bacterium]
MKKSLVLLPLLALSAFICCVSNVQSQAFSDIVGFYHVDLQPNSNLVVSGLTTKKEFQGVVTITGGTDSSSFTLSSGSLTAGALNEVTTLGDTITVPSAYMKILTAGAGENQVIDVISNTAGQIVGNITNDQLTSLGLSGGSAVVAVRKHVTIQSLFEAADNVASGDRIDIFDDSGSKVRLLRSGENWFNESFQNANAFPIYPAQGILYISTGAKSVRIGTEQVSYFDEAESKITVYSGAVNLVGQVNPLNGENGTLAGTGLQDSLSASDRVDVFQNVGGTFQKVGRYFVSGGNWFDESFVNSNSVVVPFTSAFNIISASDQAVGVENGVP